MSFFNEFFDNSVVECAKNKISCDIIFGEKISIIGNLKIDNMTNEEMVFKNKNNKIKIIGKNLNIYSMAKGEFKIEGDICGVLKEWMEK